MDLELNEKVALVQGASKGIGRGIADSLAREGCDLILTARHSEPLKAAAAEITARTGRRVRIHPADSGNLAEMRVLVDYAQSEFGRLDIVVCNSGGPPPGGLRDLTPAQWAEAATLLLSAPSYLLQLALPLLEKSSSPRFFVVTSSSTRVPIPGLTLSNVYRPAVVGLIKTMVEELGRTGLCCHSIAPGRFETDRLGHVVTMQAQKQGKSQEAIKQAMLDSIPAGRLGQPTEIGDLVAFLSSSKASYLNGGNWPIDGGLIRAI